MRHIVFSESDSYPIALLIKHTVFSQQEIDRAYVSPLSNHGLPQDQIVAMTLQYNEKGKAPVKYIREYLDELLPALDSIGAEVLYCADVPYFQQLTGAKKGEPNLGYVLPCTVEGYEHFKVILGVNHKSLLYNPANESKLMFSLDTLLDCFNNTYAPPGEDIIQEARYPSTADQVRLELQELHQYDELSCDIEAFSLRHHEAGIASIGFAWSQHRGISFLVDYVPEDNPPFFGKQVDNQEYKALIRDFFEAYQGKIRWHGSTYDLKILIYELWMADLKDTPGLLKGLEIMTKRFHDTKTVAYLATNTTAGNALGLKSLAHPFAGDWGQENIKDVRLIKPDDLLEYNLIDCLATNYVFDKYYPIMVRDEQEELYQTKMIPFLRDIIQIELTGMPMCPKAIAHAEKVLETKLTELSDFLLDPTLKPVVETERINQTKMMVAANEKLKTKQHPLEHFAEHRFNPNSDPQCRTLLYDVMELPVIDLTDGKQPATGAKTLVKLVNHTKNPVYLKIINALMEYSQASKVLSSFIPAFKNGVDKGDGLLWLHGSFNLGGTKSGRLSSSDPNLQNIPSGSTYGKLIKQCFVGPSGMLFAGADFNSLEDYISALTTKDPNKLKVYIEGYDGHSLRAYNYWPEKFPDIDPVPESVNKIKKLHEGIRQASKAPTFALTYQGTYSTLMNNCGFSEDEAKKIEANYHEMYKVSDQWVQDKLDQAAKDGYVTLAFGLRLRTPLLARALRNNRKTPYQALAEGRTAGNALGQGYGLLTNRACSAFMEKVRKSPYRHDILPVAMIHDAIYLLICDDVAVLRWVNDNLIDEMRWQDLPELEHDQVKLGAELDVFWPNWANPMTVPNYSDEVTILKLASQHQQELEVKQAA